MANDLRMARSPVVQRDGAYHLRLAGGSTAPLYDGPGSPVRSFLEGWSPTAFHPGIGPVRLLAFTGPDGAEACWLLDQGNVRLGDSLTDLMPEVAGAFLTAACPMLQRLIREVMLRPRPRPASLEAVDALLLLSHLVCEQAVEAIGDDLVLRPRMALVERLAPTISIETPDGNQAEVGIDRLHIQSGFAVTLQDRLVASTRNGVLAWPSPVNGRPLQVQGCLYLDDFRLAYRFADTIHGLVFYVIASDHLCRALGVYFPTGNLLVVKDEWSRHLADVYFPDGVGRRIASHCAAWAQELVPYFARGVHGTASIMRGPSGAHLGHQLWNELTGMETLLTHAVGSFIPEWIVAGAENGVELWGPIELLFPELEGRVNRTLADDSRIAAYLYSKGLCAARITGERISAELRRRLQASVEVGPTRRRLHALRHQPGHASNRRMPGEMPPPVILLGLRVENRTLTDLAGFCVRLAGFIAETWPGAVLVLDGHNSREGGTGLHGARIMSHGEVLAAHTPLSIEQVIAAQVRAASAGLPIHIEDTLDQPIGASLAWSMLSDCFISVWGASLAKFRWVCNKPGLAVSSRANLLHRDDLHIYDLPCYMEDPTQLLMADPASVTDEPDAPRLVPVALDNPFFANFRVDEGRLFDQFRAFVFEVTTAASLDGTAGRLPET
ncbi:MAG: hypothetical protein ACRYGI_01470 [Janthinobacterium lividum]